MSGTITSLVRDARANGYTVGVAKGDKVPFTVATHNHGHAYALSIYSDQAGQNEVARLVWSYVSADRSRFGYVLSYAGLWADRVQTRRCDSVYQVRHALKLPTN